MLVFGVFNVLPVLTVHTSVGLFSGAFLESFDCFYSFSGRVFLCDMHFKKALIVSSVMGWDWVLVWFYFSGDLRSDFFDNFV